MKHVWDLCKVLENEHRMMLLAEIYKSRDGGCNVGYLADRMLGKLELPAVSQYLKQIESLGLLRRERCGKYVNYLDDMREAEDGIRQVARMIRAEIKEKGMYDDHHMFHALMNAFRARVCRYLMEGGNGEKSAICDKFKHFSKYLVRDLQPAVEAGLLSEYVEAYELLLPADPCQIDTVDEPTVEQEVMRRYVEILADEYVREAEKACYGVCEFCGREVGTEESPRCCTLGWYRYICRLCAEKGVDGSPFEFEMNGNYYKGKTRIENPFKKKGKSK